MTMTNNSIGDAMLRLDERCLQYNATRYSSATAPTNSALQSPRPALRCCGVPCKGRRLGVTHCPNLNAQTEPQHWAGHSGNSRSKSCHAIHLHRLIFSVVVRAHVFLFVFFSCLLLQIPPSAGPQSTYYRLSHTHTHTHTRTHTQHSLTASSVKSSNRPVSVSC